MPRSSFPKPRQIAAFARTTASHRLAAPGLAALGLALLIAGEAVAAPPPPTSIAIELESGRILLANEPDALRHPASLSKLMTVYLSFEALAADDIDQEALITVSKHAADQPPVKAYLRAGARVPFIELVAAAGVASSNDAAVAVAEALAGSEAAFVERMNAAAEELGMVNTRFANASGLPAEGQRITARDVALLAQAILSRHPGRAKILGLSAVSALGRRLTSTNPLMGSYDGVKGLKTGFTCKAGYSLAALAERGGRHVLAVALGHPSKDQRRSAARKLLDQAFEKASTDDSAAAAPELAPAPSASAAEPASVAACGRGGGGLRGWATMLGVYGGRGEASRAIQRGRIAGESYLLRRTRDRKWVALVHAMNRNQAIKTCRRARTAGRYCITLSPAALRNRNARWR